MEPVSFVLGAAPKAVDTAMKLGTNQPIGMPDAPHPWCAGSGAEVDDLVLYLLTL